jgi:hypothetical protein
MQLPATPADALTFALHFDAHVAEGLSLDAQTAFIRRWTDSPDFNALKNTHLDFADILRLTSSRFWDIYHPANLVRVPSDRLPVLAQIAARPGHPACQFIVEHVINAIGSLPPATRALFCAARMRWRVHGNAEQLFFGTCFHRLCLLAESRGEPLPGAPSPVLRRGFLPSFPYSYEAQLPAPLRDAIEADAPVPFAMAMALCGRRLSKHLLLYLLTRAAGHILAEYLPALRNARPLADVVLYCASSLPADPAIALLHAIDRADPGAVARAADLFGNNALWNLLYREEDRYGHVSSDTPRLETTLLALGCDPDRPNILALTPRHLQTAFRLLST